MQRLRINMNIFIRQYMAAQTQ